MDAVIGQERSVRGARSIATQIKRAIQSGALAHDDQLPSERELSETYSASRSTIRKALDWLEDEGFVIRKVGSGTFVNYSSAEESDLQTVIDQISPVQMVEARIGFERQMVRLAIVHANQSDIEAMQSIIQLMDEAVDDSAAFAKHDSEFHLTLARASRNPLIVQLYHQIDEVRNHAQWRTARKRVLTSESAKLYNEHHRALVESLKNRNVDAAIDALNAHMELAHKHLVSGLNF